MNVTDLLPQTTDEFGDAAYWDRFFAQGEAADFEWYTNAKTLMPIIEQYVFADSLDKNSIRFIIPGCGTSDLAFSLNDRGYGKVYPCDYSDVALQRVQSKAKKLGSPVKFHKRDACKFSTYTDAEALEWFKPNSINMIIDKGLLDSISSDHSDFAVQQCMMYLDEIKRLVISDVDDAGTILIVTMAQTSVLDILHAVFPLDRWIFVVHFISSLQGDTNRYQPVVVALTPRRSSQDDKISYVLDYGFLTLERPSDTEARCLEFSFDAVKRSIAEHQRQRHEATTSERLKKFVQSKTIRRSYCIEVKPAGIDTNLDELRTEVENLLMRFTDLHCESIETRPVAYGLKKLVLSVTVTSSDVPSSNSLDIDFVAEELLEELGEDLVQSIDVIV